MRRKEQGMLMVFAVLLLILYLLSSTDLIIKEADAGVCPVSVILEGDTDENYANFRKGMEQAAIELNADVSVISLYEANNRQQQLELMLREQQDGARALVVIPVDEQEIEQAVTQKQLTVPLILCGAELPLDKVSAVIAVDYYGMGQLLAEKALEKQGEDRSFCLLSGTSENTISKSFEQGIRSVLSARGLEAVLYREPESEAFPETFQMLVKARGGKAVILALDPEGLMQAASLMNEDSGLREQTAGLYGRGTTISVLNQLDRDIVDGICVTDEFSAGYLSVKKAVEAATNQLTEPQVHLEPYYIEKKDLRDPVFEKMLYPIE